MKEKKEKEFSFNGFSKEEIFAAIEANRLIPTADMPTFKKEVQFTDSEYLRLGRFLTKIRVPDPHLDTFMEFSPPSKVISWRKREQKDFCIVSAPACWKRNLLIQSGVPGEPSRLLKRNFRVNADSLGHLILAVITLHWQKNYYDQKDYLVLDIEQTIESESEVDPRERLNEIGQGVKELDILPRGVDQFKIPGTKSYVRFSRINGNPAKPKTDCRPKTEPAAVEV